MKTSTLRNYLQPVVTQYSIIPPGNLIISISVISIFYHAEKKDKAGNNKAVPSDKLFFIYFFIFFKLEKMSRSQFLELISRMAH